MLDRYRASTDKNEPLHDNVSPGKPAERNGFVDFILVLAQAMLIALVVMTFLFQSFNIPSGSLIPNLLVGDYVFVSKYAYGYSKVSFPFLDFSFKGRLLGSEPKRGDIAVFRNDKDEGRDYIKRVVGLPGDRIQIVDATIYINGTPVKKELVGDYVTDKPYRVARKVPRYRETLPNGVSYTTIEVENGHGYLSNTGEYVVPPGQYFMMGDNREDSQDSRVPSKVGFVPLDNFIGRAELVYLSIDHGSDAAATQNGLWPWLMSMHFRWERLFRRVH